MKKSFTCPVCGTGRLTLEVNQGTMFYEILEDGSLEDPDYDTESQDLVCENGCEIKDDFTYDSGARTFTWA